MSIKSERLDYFQKVLRPLGKDAFPLCIRDDEFRRRDIPLRNPLLNEVRNVLEANEIKISRLGTHYHNLFMGGYVRHDLSVESDLGVLAVLFEDHFRVLPGYFELRDGPEVLGYSMTRSVAFGSEWRAVLEEVRVSSSL